ncbi:MAG: hypothetical protein ACREL7_16740 [Longimicrobiales bacterium]
MRRCLVFAALLAAFGGVQPLDAQAPRPSRPGGMFLGAGAGGGWTRAACSYCRRDYSFGPVVFARIGGRLGPRSLLGAELSGWTRNDGEEDVRLLTGSLMAVGWLYPNPDGPFYLKGGLGAITFRVFGDGDDDDLSSLGPALQLGAGYEFRLSDRVLLTNYANLQASRFGKLRSGETVVVDNLGVTALQFGIGITRF